MTALRPNAERPGRRTAASGEKRGVGEAETVHEEPAPRPEEVVSRRSSRETRLEAPDVTAQEPVVTINIGRIEVRAVNPEKPPTDERGPALSLEEYMKRRNKRNQ